MLYCHTDTNDFISIFFGSTKLWNHKRSLIAFYCLLATRHEKNVEKHQNI